MSGADAAGRSIDSLEANTDSATQAVNLERRTKMPGRVFGWLDRALGSANQKLHLRQKREKDGMNLKMVTEKKQEKVMICVKGEFQEEEEKVEGRQQRSTKQQASDNSSRETEQHNLRLQRQLPTEGKKHGEEEEKGETKKEERVVREAEHEERECGGDFGDLPEIVRIRQRNIARNQAMMAALTLPQASTDMRFVP